MAQADRTGFGAGEVAAIAAEGFVFGYPLVLMDRTRAAFLRVRSPGGRARQMNEVVHARQLPTPASTTVVRPNTDTLYSTGWLDLSAGPVLVHTPPAEGRYWMMSLHSAWTDVIASLGPRTTGPAARTFAVVGPDYDGLLPAGVSELRCPTALAWVIGRTPVYGSDDLPAAHHLQDQITLTACSPPDGLTELVPVPFTEPGPGAPPPAEVEAMDPDVFFGRLAALLMANPAAGADRPMLDQLAAIGLEPGRFHPDPAEAEQVEAGMQVGVSWLRPPTDRRQPERGGWRTTPGLGAFGTNYRLRARIAHAGLGANLAEDALYFRTAHDGHEEPLHGARCYEVHFAAGQRPPVRAFWSLTVYNDQGYLIENPIGRYGIGDRHRIVGNQDGSLDLCLSHTPPDPNRRANWLPVPHYSFELVLRLYWPTREALNGTWAPPAVRTTTNQYAPSAGDSRSSGS
jgi:hypothetical protein